MTNEECRAEALRRVAESDRLLDELAVECTRTLETEEQVYRRVAHLRQTAGVFAALAGPETADDVETPERSAAIVDANLGRMGVTLGGPREAR